MFNRILIPLDGSILAERTIPYAEQFARIFGSTIILLQVLDPTSYHENPKSVDPLRWQIRKTEADLYLSAVAARMNEHLRPLDETPAKARVEYAIREGKAAENIIAFSHSESIDLVVICTHGSGGLSRWNISSVTQKVINLVYLPVLVVRAYTHIETDRTIRFRRILLPIDSSRRAECALPAGIALAQGEALLEANPPAAVSSAAEQPEPVAVPMLPAIILAAVMTPTEIPIPAPYPLEISKLTEQLYLFSREAVHAYLNEMRLRLPVESEIRLVENANVSTGIHELANHEEDVDLVVLCAHGYTGQTLWPYGSVARNYIEHGNRPVLIIQDIVRSQVPPTAAEIAAERTGGR